MERAYGNFLFSYAHGFTELLRQLVDLWQDSYGPETARRVQVFHSLAPQFEVEIFEDLYPRLLRAEDAVRQRDFEAFYAHAAGEAAKLLEKSAAGGWKLPAGKDFALEPLLAEVRELWATSAERTKRRAWAIIDELVRDAETFLASLRNL